MTHYDPWFSQKEVITWRKLLVNEYKRATKRYIEVKSPDVLKRERSALRAEMIKIGRCGLELTLEEERGHGSMKRLLRVRENRARVSAALDGFLHSKPWRDVRLKDVRDRAGLHITPFYRAFHSGLPGIYSWWATKELEDLVARTRAHAAESDRLQRRGLEILRTWSDLATAFVMEKPHGRLPLIAFIVYEIDSIGASMVAKASPYQGADLHDRYQAIHEFAGLAAGLHRAGARLIHELRAIIERDWDQLGGLRADSEALWPDRQDATWNAAVAFWQANLTNLFAVGVLEAESEVKRLREFSFNSWAKGAARPAAATMRHGPAT
jgi:hypothetical protein